MKMKWVMIAYALVSIPALMILVSRENVYVVIALLFGMLGHREFWSLIRYRRLPVIDERIRENLTGAMRLTGIFFFIVGIILVLLLRFNVFQDAPTGLIISGKLVVVGFVYLLSYHYYDRVRPNLGEAAMRWLKVCLITAGVSLSTIALAIVLHNLVSAWLGFEEAIFFVLGLFAAPAVLLVSLLGGLAVFLKGLWVSFQGIEPA